MPCISLQRFGKPYPWISTSCLALQLVLIPLQPWPRRITFPEVSRRGRWVPSSPHLFTRKPTRTTDRSAQEHFNKHSCIQTHWRADGIQTISPEPYSHAFSSKQAETESTWHTILLYIQPLIAPLWICEVWFMGFGCLFTNSNKFEFLMQNQEIKGGNKRKRSYCC